jgi:pSer/pThr/pTyr-binding forkhead associated (FHA) protein
VQKILLHLESPDGTQKITLENEISFGRTNLANIAINDGSLSRLHATIFREGDQIWIADENSTNGTFVNGEKILDEKILHDKDEILLGNDTHIFVEFAETSVEKNETPKPKKVEKVKETKQKVEKTKIPMFVILSVLSMFLIVFSALAAILFFAKTDDKPSTNVDVKKTPIVFSSSVIPVRVIDPLGNEDQQDLADLIDLLDADIPDEVQNDNDLAEVSSTVSENNKEKPSDLNVPIAFWQKQRELATANRGEATSNAASITLPKELERDGVIKQKAKLREMVEKNYQQPMDFAELAQKRISKDLIELPMATQTYLLNVGGSASEGEFSSFSFDDGYQPITQGMPKYQILQQLANNFDGQKYSLDSPKDRKQMRIRLLRMFNQRSKPILERLAKAYFEEFKRPLYVTSLTRSMDYQIGLNKINPNSFKVKGKGSLPPHTSGCAFDLTRKYLTAREQNFLMQQLAKMESEGIIDALIEGSANACFHVFIYDDGKPPKM